MKFVITPNNVRYQKQGLTPAEGRRGAVRRRGTS